MGWGKPFGIDLGIGNAYASITGSSASPSGGRCKLDELIAKAAAVEKECLAGQDSQQARLDKVNEIKDEFNRQKAEIYLQLESCRTWIRERQAIQRSCGNSVEAIERGVKIQGSIKQLEADFRKLADTYTRQCKQRAKLNLEESELTDRYKDLELLKRQIQECRAAARGREGSSSFVEHQYKTLTELRSAETGGYSGGAAMAAGAQIETAEDREVVDRWRQRDQEFDRHIEEIGEAIDRVGEVAVTIGEKADMQVRMAQELQTQTDEAAQELQLVNNKLKSVMKKQNNVTCCCRVILGVILLGLVLLTALLVSGRIKSTSSG